MGICLSREPGFDLGPQYSIKGVEGQGWKFKTEVKEATIKAAGNGRYALETQKVGDIACEKKIVPMKDITTLVGMSIDSVIEFSSVEDCDKYIEMAGKDGGYSKDKILEYYEHFMFGFGGKTHLNYATWTVNHADKASDGLNLIAEEKDLSGGKYAIAFRVVKDIKVGDELYKDYRRFEIPAWFQDFMKKNKLKDVRQGTLSAVYGEEYEKTCGKSDTPWKSVRK
jgi:hypothetical protein